MLKLKLKETLQERGVLYPYTWLLKTAGIGGTPARKLLNGEKTTISFDNLDALCQVLKCTPNDLFYYVQDGRQTPITPDHPLNTLEKPDTITDWKKLLKKLPPEKIAELSKELNEQLTIDANPKL